MTQEYLSSLWERLRGSCGSGARQAVGRCISPLEARTISHLLGVLSENLMEFVVTQSKMDADASTKANEDASQFSLGAVINKAVSEVARLDHSFPSLAAVALSNVSLLLSVGINYIKYPTVC